MDAGDRKSFGGRFLAAVRRHFTGGVLVTVPVVVTLYVLYFLFQKIDGLLSPRTFSSLSMHSAVWGAWVPEPTLR